jgi:hypothetical protein
MEQPHTQQRQESPLNVINCPGPAPLSMTMLWNSLDPSIQNQLTQCLAELIYRIRKADAAIGKEAADEQ